MASPRTEIQIDAPQDEVWEVLADVSSYPNWDSGFISLEGELALGATLKLEVEASPGRTFKPKVTELNAPTGMVWTGGMPLGLMKGVPTYKLAAAGERTSFEMTEEFSGPLAGIIGRSMPDLQPTFDKFAAGLKARVEGG